MKSDRLLARHRRRRALLVCFTASFAAALPAAAAHEVVQLGFRSARMAGLSVVHGIDVQPKLGESVRGSFAGPSEVHSTPVQARTCPIPALP